MEGQWEEIEEDDSWLQEFEEKLDSYEEGLRQDGRTQQMAVYLSALELRNEGAMLTREQQEHLNAANRQKLAPSYNDLWEMDWPTFKLGKGQTYLRGRELAWLKHAAVNDIAKMPCNHVTEDLAKLFLSTLNLGKDGREKLKQSFRRLSGRAIKAGYIRYCPFADTKIREDRTTEDRTKFWNPETEYPLIVEHARDDDARELFGFSMGAGPRPAEARNFEWSDVDMENDTLTFRYGGSEDGATKGGKPVTVPMCAEAKQWLQRRVDRLHRGVKPDHGIVFPKKNGEAYARNYDFGLAKTLKAVGIEKNGRGLYAFRHGFCVALANDFFGDHWSRAEAREMMRHSDEKTIDYYYRVLKHRLADKAAQSKPLTNVADFSDLEHKDLSPKADGAIDANPFPNAGDFLGFERANPSESLLKRKGTTRHGRQWSVSRSRKTSTKTILP